MAESSEDVKPKLSIIVQHEQQRTSITATVSSNNSPDCLLVVLQNVP